MLRRLKIGTRVNLLIAVPLIALLALTAVSYIALQRASVRGDEYQQLKAAEALRSDIVPPPASLLEAWADVNHLAVLVASPVSDRTNIEIDDSLTHLRDTRTKYMTAIAYWRAQPMEPAAKASFQSGAQTGEAFFAKVDNVLMPAMVTRDPATVISAVRSLEDSFKVEQVFIGASLTLVDREVSQREASVDNFVNKVVLVISAAVLTLLLLCLVVAFFVRRSIVRPILALSKQARRVATSDLPDAVHQIQSLPADAPMPTVEPFRIETHDELADLGASFNSVQSAALDLAAEQAMARRTVADNLVNIARRTQTLLGRSLTSLSDMEQSERDPEALQNLFKLDHLTTRMKRNAQSLLVLAGAEQNRLWSAPVPIGDVIRAAVSEIENYARVDLGDLGMAAVQGSLAPDIAHLLAELLENATSFSPPTSRVMVVGRSFADGHQIGIVDYGIGMTQDEVDAANVSLRRQADFDMSSSKMLGFQVIARLAARHGIQVMLAQTAGATGVTAIIKLPLSVLDNRNVERQPAITPPSAPLPQRTLEPPPVAVQSHPQPQPITGPVAVVPPPAVDASVSDEELWALVDTPMPLPALPVASVAPAAEPGHFTVQATPPFAPAQPPTAMPLASGLTKRVRGAQLPDLGTTGEDPAAWGRPAEEVRTSLASLQRGVDMGRQNHDD